MILDEETLKHHGILGMKWGVRRPVGPGGRVKQTLPTVGETGKPLRSRDVKLLTNQEIKAINERLTLEKNFKNLSPSTAEKGYRALKKALAVGGTIASAYALYESPAGKAVRKAVTKTIKTAA